MRKSFLGQMLLGLGVVSFVLAQQPTAKERASAIKETFQYSQQRLRTYEWIETTTVSMKDEVKSQKQNRCYYGADGNIQKVPVSATPPPEKKRGLRGKIVEHKKEELTEYMQQAVDLVKSYAPPNADLLQKSINGGNLLIHVPQPNQRVAVEFGSYIQPGDSLSIEVDMPSNRVLSAKVSTYLGTPEDPVKLDVRFGVLNDINDRTIYTTTVTLDAAAKNVRVVVQNTGYRPM